MPQRRCSAQFWKTSRLTKSAILILSIHDTPTIHALPIPCTSSPMPPIAKLSPEQAMYHFMSGYTAKVAGTERGVTEPSATFSTCFGAPFMPLHPRVYGKLLAERLVASGSRVWLVNTGWTGGAYGVGNRMKIAYTRAMIRAALTGQLDKATYKNHPVFNLD